MRGPSASWGLLFALAVACSDASSGAGDPPGDGGGAAPEPPPPLPVEKQVLDTTLFLGATGTVFADPANALAGQQNAGFGIDVVTPDGGLLRRMFVTFSQHDDVASALQRDAVVVSNDGGGTFGDYRAGVMSSPAFAVELRDGRVVSYGFVPTARTDSGGKTHLTLRAQESRDQGATWQDLRSVATVSLSSPGLGRLCGHPIELGDGTILLEYYGRAAADAGGFRSDLLASTDGGRTFELRGSIAVPPAGYSYPEADVVELQDGSLYAVVRVHGPDGSLRPLLATHSTDGGRTFAPLEPVLLPVNGGAPAPRAGIAPRMTLLPDGVLLLSTGRFDNVIAMSTEPDHVEWRDARVTYVNYPRDTTAAYSDAVLRVHGSSGNTTVEVLAANRAMQFGDNCANGWGCPPADSDYIIDGRNRVWRRFLEVNTPDVGKIDLLSKYRSGAIQVTTDLDWTSADHPRARIEGAFDGSNAYWSSAVKRGGGPGEFVVALDRMVYLTRIGLSIRRGLEASAHVYISLDGEHWDELYEARRRTHRAIEYRVLADPVAATHVKVVVDTDAPCDDDLGDGCAFLNELELYSAIDSFENDPVGGPPRGYSEVTGAWVTGYQAGATSRALRLQDGSASAASRAVWQGVPAAEKTLELALQPIALTSGFLFSITGVDATGAPVDAYHLGVLADGSVAAYDATAGSWQRLSDPGLVAIGETTQVRVEATLDSARILVDGEEIASVAPSSPGATSLSGHVFSSGGTAPTGDHVLVDDVYFR